MTQVAASMVLCTNGTTAIGNCRIVPAMDKHAPWRPRHPLPWSWPPEPQCRWCWQALCPLLPALHQTAEMSAACDTMTHDPRSIDQPAPANDALTTVQDHLCDQAPQGHRAKHQPPSSRAQETCSHCTKNKVSADSHSDQVETCKVSLATSSRLHALYNDTDIDCSAE